MDDRLVEQITSEEEDSNASLRPYEILTYPADYTLEVLVEKWRKKEIRVPDLQRGFVWSQAQSSRLIESFLMGLPVPPVYFYQDREDNTLLVVDGQQRLRSVVYFFSGLFGDKKEGKSKITYFSLIGLDEKSPFVDATYETLKEKDQASFNKLNNSVLRSFVMKQLEPQDDTSIFQVFERLNTGGMVLQGQEIRNCIYSGPFNDLLRKLNKHESWRKIIGRKPADKRMRDVELILRFFALLYNVNNYKRPMKKFLNDFMKTHKRPSQAKQDQFETIFTDTTNAVINYLGPKPFHIRRGLNAAVYDSVFTAFARRINEVSKPSIPIAGTRLKAMPIVSEAKAQEKEERYRRLLADEKYNTWVISHTTDEDVVPDRINKAEEILFGKSPLG